MSAQPLLGLDIGSHSIKLIQLEQQKAGFFLHSMGNMPAPAKGLASESQADLESMAVAIKKLVLDCRTTTRKVNVSLPESQIFTRVIEMLPLNDEELSSAIKWEAEQYIPMPLAEVHLDFAILSKPEKNSNEKMNVLLVAAPLSLIEKYQKILELAGLEAYSLEPEIIALARCLITDQQAPNLIINLGADTTDLAIFRNGGLTFTRSISSGGETLAKAVAEDLGLELSQAEEYKRTYGLEEDKFEGKILASIKPILDTIIDEIKRGLIFYQGKYPNEMVKIATLCGGTAKLPGLAMYLAQNIGVEAQIGNPWQKVSRDYKFFPKIEDDGPVYGIAVGLAMKEVL